MYLHTHTYSGMNFRTNDVVYYIIAWHYLERSNTQKSNKRANREKITLLNVCVGARTIIATNRSEYSIKICWRFVIHYAHAMRHSHRHIFHVAPRTNDFFSSCYSFGEEESASDTHQKMCTCLKMFFCAAAVNSLAKFSTFGVLYRSQAKNVVRHM